MCLKDHKYSIAIWRRSYSKKAQCWWFDYILTIWVCNSTPSEKLHCKAGRHFRWVCAYCVWTKLFGWCVVYTYLLIEKDIDILMAIHNNNLYNNNLATQCTANAGTVSAHLIMQVQHDIYAWGTHHIRLIQIIK